MGAVFNVVRKDNLIILKKIESLTEEEIREMDELNKIWKDIDEGKGTTTNKKDFLEEMNSW